MKSIIIFLLFTSYVTSVMETTLVYDFNDQRLEYVRSGWPVTVLSQSGNVCLIDWDWKDGGGRGIIQCDNLR